MRVLLERTGGFAGISKKINIDTSQIPQQQAEELSRLVTAAGLFQLPTLQGDGVPPTAGDRFQYQITLEDNGKIHTIIVNEAVLPHSLKMLIEWLNQAASL
ncbi:protealysin inhibitor emfourin [Anabaena sp. CCY 9910]|uniref:protealysin inhibitor emfourin n=1 Tax=Anabaena sp. CCY 9910 TaxID=3103870 RepID=UPI0039DFE663